MPNTEQARAADKKSVLIKRDLLFIGERSLLWFRQLARFNLDRSRSIKPDLSRSRPDLSTETNPAICNSLPGFAGRLLGAGETELYQWVRCGCRKLHLPGVSSKLAEKIGSARGG